MTRLPGTRRGGFTLVEMLIVIIIIGILAAILIPTVAAVRRKASETRMALELSQIDKAMEAYKLKHNDYPPNFFDINLVKRHMRTAFPQAKVAPVAGQYASSPGQFGYPNGPYEIVPGWDIPGRPDAAECIVFWLDGLSSDPRFPFTGPGGPLVKLPSGELALNPERNEGFFTFNRGRIGIYLADPSNGSPTQAGVPLSNDEVLLHGGTLADSDPFPTYFPQGLALVNDTDLGNAGPPYVYFDSRSYTLPPTVTGGQYMRAVWTTGNQSNPYDASTHNPLVPGVAAPYHTAETNPKRNPAADTASNPNNPGNHLYYANRDRFQIIAAGLDGNFGGAACVYPTGETMDIPPVVVGYRIPMLATSIIDGDLDNVTNFSEG